MNSTSKEILGETLIVIVAVLIVILVLKLELVNWFLFFCFCGSVLYTVTKVTKKKK